ncbi:Mitochondrial translocator assembly and maintenance protein 41 [Blyttiomyces sp. JEL0837]|nr:Mitochondrial translocator assembly and maintenance protein 41 [Blyttiomyces sp. JEL0837]
MVDLIFGVTHPQHWHSLNIRDNKEHYSSFAGWGSRAVSVLQERVGAGIYYNTSVEVDGMKIKYGVISMDRLIRDLNEWDSLYVAGRMQKPIKILRGDSRVKLANDVNLTNAMRVALLCLPGEFSEEELFKVIVGLSYQGDFRMSVGGENPHKIHNIVSAQLSELRTLYKPIIENLPNISYKNGITDLNFVNGEFGEGLMLRQEIDDARLRGNLVLGLPKRLRERVVGAYLNARGGSGGVSASDGIDNQELAQEIAASPKAKTIVLRAIGDIVRLPALTQSIKGIITAGPIKSVKYASEKLKKGLAAKK